MAFAAPPRQVVPRAFLRTATLAVALFGPVGPAAAAPLRASVAATAGYAEGAQARLQGQLDVGLGPAWAWRFAGGPAYVRGQAGAQLLAGPVYGLDALRYVPRLVALFGADVPTGALRLQGGGELARTFGLHADVFVGAYATWRPGGQAGALLTTGVAWEL